MYLLYIFLTIIPNSITVDGILHRNQMAAYYKDTTTIYTGKNSLADSHLALDSVFVAKDRYNVYLRIFSSDTLWLGNYGDLFVAIDTGSPEGGLYSPYSKHIKFSGNLPDYVVYVNDNGECYLLSYNDTSKTWDNTGTEVLCDGAGTHPDFEIAFPRDSIGSATDIKVLVYTTYRDSGDGVIDYSVGDTAYANVLLDASKDEDYSLLGVSDQSTQDGANLDSMFVTWDSLYLYIYITTLNTSSWDVAYGIGLDVDQKPESGYYTGDSDAWGRRIDFGDTLSAEPYTVDYEIYFWWSGADQAITSANFCVWDGDSFVYVNITDSTSWYAYSGGANGLQALEIKVPLSSIGENISKIHMSAWVTGGNNSSAVDIIPHDDQISNNSDEWSDVDTIFTYVVINVDKPGVQDVTVPFTSGYGKSPDIVSEGTSLSLSTSLITFGYYDYSNWGNTPVGFLYPIDGVIDTGGFYEDEMLLCSDSKNAWLTWDSDSIYIGYTYQAFDSGYGGDGDLFVYFQTDSVTDINPYGDAGSNIAINWWNGDSIVLKFNADYAIGVEDGSYYALYKYVDSIGEWRVLYSNADGNFPGNAFIGYDNSPPGNGVTEISLSRAALGNPEYLGVIFFVHSDASGTMFGISPIDDTLNQRYLKEISNTDGVNDSIYHFWGIYRLTTSGIAVNSVKDYYIPLGVSESNIQQESAFQVVNKVLYLNNTQHYEEVGIYSITGRRVLYTELRGNKAEISLKNLPEGIYFVKLLRSKRLYRLLLIR